MSQEEVKVLKQEERTYWRNNFFIVLLPFVLLGLPVHSILPSKRTADMQQKLDLSWRYWLRFRILSPVAILMNVVLLPFFIYTNYVMLSTLATLVIDVIIKGLITLSDISAFMQFLYLLPFFVIVNCAWMYGHLVNYVIRTFDTPTSVLQVTTCIRVAEDLPKNATNLATHCVDTMSMQVRNAAVQTPKYICSSQLQSGSQIHILQVEQAPLATPRSPDPCYRRKLSQIYFLIFAAPLIHIFTTWYRVDHEDWSCEEILNHVQLYMATITYTLVLPVYATFCRTIACQFNVLRGSIKDCIQRGERMRESHIYFIKKAYQQIADSIVTTNVLFGIFVTGVLLALDIFAAFNCANLWSPIVDKINGGISNIMKNGTTSFVENLLEITSDDFVVPPAVVRYWVGIAMETLLYVCLVWLVMTEAILTNEKARHLIVWINDFASETMAPKRHEGDANLNTDVPGGKTDGASDYDIYREVRKSKG